MTGGSERPREHGRIIWSEDGKVIGFVGYPMTRIGVIHMSIPSYLKMGTGIPGQGFSVYCTQCRRPLDSYGAPSELSGRPVAHIHDPHTRGRVCGLCDPGFSFDNPTPPRP